MLRVCLATGCNLMVSKQLHGQGALFEPYRPVCPGLIWVWIGNWLMGLPFPAPGQQHQLCTKAVLCHEIRVCLQLSYLRLAHGVFEAVRAGAIDGKRPPVVMVGVKTLPRTSIHPRLEGVNLCGVLCRKKRDPNKFVQLNHRSSRKSPIKPY
jgi:hypothetical protein